MSEEELIRLYKLMEKLNWFFHNEMHYLDKSISEKMALECYPEIREFTYDILWNEHLLHVYLGVRRESDRHELRQSDRQGNQHYGIGGK